MISDFNEASGFTIPSATKPKARRLVLSDINAIARLVATRKMTENDACITLGIKPSQWQVWKSRAKCSELFENIIARVRGNQVDTLISRIEAAGEDYEIQLPNGNVINKRGDWRAPAWLLEKTAPQFAPQQISQVPQVTVQIGIIHEQLKRVIGFSNTALETSLLESNGVTADTSSGCPINDSGEIKRIKMPVRRNTI